MGALGDRLMQPDMVGLPDWQAADVLTAPDASLPVLVELVAAPIGIGSVLAVLGATAGAAVLDALNTLGAQVSAVKWAFRLLESGDLDVGMPVVRQQLDALVATGAITEDQVAVVKALGEVRRHPSWAEANGIEVTARTVGLARGAI